MQFWKQKFKDHQYLGIAILLVIILFLLTVPFFLGIYYIRLLQLIAIYVLLATGLNLVAGYAGQVSLGHGALYAVGAYSSALLSTRLGLPFWISLPLAVLITGSFGIMLGIPALRVKGPYLAMVTIGFGLIIERVLVEWTSFTGGPIGINDIPAPHLGVLVFSGKTMYYLVMLCMGLGLLIAYNIVDGRWGRAFKSLRENEIAAEAMGVNTRKFKLLAFTLSAMFAGAAGSLYAHLSGYISPDTFTFNFSVFALLIVIIGGMGTLVGPVIGAVVLTLLPELLNGFDRYKLLIYGLLLIISVLVMRDGIAGLAKRLLMLTINPPKGMTDAQGVDRMSSLPLSLQHNTGIILELRNVNKLFGGLTAVHDLNLKVTAGTIHALIGPNGAGKTTVINLISGIYRPTSGNLFFGNGEITASRPYVRVEQGISRTFQNVQLFPKMTALENILVGNHTRMTGALWVAALRMPWIRSQERTARHKAMALLDFVGLSLQHNELAGKLPYGHQRLLEIARALASDPQLLLLDEPAAGLNEKEIEELELIILKIRDHGITVLLIEHHMNLVMGISNIITVLDYGKKIAEGSPEAVQDDQLVIAAYLGTEVA